MGISRRITLRLKKTSDHRVGEAVAPNCHRISGSEAKSESTKKRGLIVEVVMVVEGYSVRVVLRVREKRESCSGRVRQPWKNTMVLFVI